MAPETQRVPFVSGVHRNYLGGNVTYPSSGLVRSVSATSEIDGGSLPLQAATKLSAQAVRSLSAVTADVILLPQKSESRVRMRLSRTKASWDSHMSNAAPVIKLEDHLQKFEGKSRFEYSLDFWSRRAEELSVMLSRCHEDENSQHDVEAGGTVMEHADIQSTKETCESSDSDSSDGLVMNERTKIVMGRVLKHWSHRMMATAFQTLLADCKLQQTHRRVQGLPKPTRARPSSSSSSMAAKSKPSHESGDEDPGASVFSEKSKLIVDRVAKHWTNRAIAMAFSAWHSDLRYMHLL